MGRNGLKYRKLKIFGIAAGLAGVLFLVGCTKTAGQDGSKAGAAGTSETAGIQEAAGTQDTNRQMQTVPLVMERKHESLEMEQQWPLKGQGLRLTGPMSLFHLPEHTA